MHNEKPTIDYIVTLRVRLQHDELPPSQWCWPADLLRDIEEVELIQCSELHSHPRQQGGAEA